MPLISSSDFSPSFWMSNAHVQTIYPSLFRKVNGVNYSRERLELSDGDFIDLDFSKIGSQRILIVLHGLEGSSDRPYVKGMVKLFNKHNWDAVGINFRGCSGEPNRLARTYHSGETDDLHAVISKLEQEEFYEEIAILGFSLGGNVTMKYIGQKGRDLNPKIKKAIAFSAPIHLESASYELAKWHNKLYMNRFMVDLKEKVKNRETIIRPYVDLDKVYASSSFLDFDNYFTAPVHGFDNALDYWTKSSSKQYLENIQIKALLVNAKDDSFLSDQCYPEDVADKHKNFHFESPKRGGHVGFVSRDKEGFLWSERRALNFCMNN